MFSITYFNLQWFITPGHSRYLWFHLRNDDYKLQCSGISASPESITCMKNDVECILAGPDDENVSFYLHAALSDIHKLFTAAKVKGKYLFMIMWKRKIWIKMSTIFLMFSLLIGIIISDLISGTMEVKMSGEFTKRYSESAAFSLVPKEKLKLCIKKLEYYLSWSQEYYKDICL